jgi:hypothetical protein
MDEVSFQLGEVKLEALKFSKEGGFYHRNHKWQALLQTQDSCQTLLPRMA